MITFAIKRETATKDAFTNLKGMDVCICCEFFDGWVSNIQVSQKVENVISVARELYQTNKEEFDNMMCNDMEGVAQELFKYKKTFGRVLAFLVFAVIHFPEEKLRTCTLLKQL